jgi:hypothetical protein
VAKPHHHHHHHTVKHTTHALPYYVLKLSASKIVSPGNRIRCTASYMGRQLTGAPLPVQAKHQQVRRSNQAGSASAPQGRRQCDPPFSNTLMSTRPERATTMTSPSAH